MNRYSTSIFHRMLIILLCFSLVFSPADLNRITAYSDLADERISHEQVPEPAMIVNNEGNYTADTGIDGISFLYEGSEIESDAPVSAELTYDIPDLDYDSFDIYSDVIHFADDMTVIMESESKQDILSEDVDSDTMKFETESFSS